MTAQQLAQLASDAAHGRPAGRSDLERIAALDDGQRSALLAATMAVRRARSGLDVNMEGIVSAKTGACSEDCAFCSQSARFQSGVAVRPLMRPDEAVEAAMRAWRDGATEFCLVIAVRGPNERVLDGVVDCVRAVRAATPLKVAVSLGIMSRAQIARLRSEGVAKVNHNLEAGRRFFPAICSTHTYDERLATCEAVKAEGLELCSGGIFGMGETIGDRIELALELQRLDADEVPVNFLDPRPGTPLGERPLISVDEALRCIALVRFALPRTLIRLSGGRERTLGERQLLGLAAGADGMIVGDYLTTSGQSPALDRAMAQSFATLYAAEGA